jgi:hypothetical protein
MVVLTELCLNKALQYSQFVPSYIQSFYFIYGMFPIYKTANVNGSETSRVSYRFPLWERLENIPANICQEPIFSQAL